MNLQPLLEFIGYHESRNNYDIVYGGIREQHRPPRQLSTMTVQQVLNWQDSIDRLYPSEAAGKYQIMEDTLRGLVPPGDAWRIEAFSPAIQDRLAIELLERRGLQDYVDGTISAEKFANSIAKEWASMPVVTNVVGHAGVPVRRGQSYYAGDGLNKAHGDPIEFLTHIRAIKSTPPVEKRAVDNTKPKKRWWEFWK